MKKNFAKIPSVNILLEALSTFEKPFAHHYKKILIEQVIDQVRQHPERYKLHTRDRTKLIQVITEEVKHLMDALLDTGFKRVYNATGVVLHTGLGRAPLGSASIEQLSCLSGFTNLEIQLASGRRGDRLSHVTPLLRLFTGAEDSVVVNNNAAAVLLTLNSLARRKEVIISRGEQVEIGGSFRMPEVMISSGAKMIEVGTTNKTHLDDYRQAINEKTAAIMLVHPSNYHIIGFTTKPETKEIIDLAHTQEIPVFYDLGSGALIDMRRFGFDYEPVVSEVIDAGVDIITFSGDKLLGGPQAGIIVGKKDLVFKIRKNHLLRALRCDKIILALLRHVLQGYLDPETVDTRNETLHLFSQKPEMLYQRAQNLHHALQTKTRKYFTIIESDGRVGSGAYPVFPITSYALEYTPGPVTAEQLARRLRLFDTPVFGYFENDKYRLNMLALSEADIHSLPDLIENVL